MENLLHNLRWCAAGLTASGLLLAVPFLLGGDSDGPVHEIVVFVLLYLWPFATAYAAMRATGAVATTLRLLAEPVLILGSVFAVVLMYVAALATMLSPDSYASLIGWDIAAGTGCLMYTGAWLLEVGARALHRGKLA